MCVIVVTGVTNKKMGLFSFIKRIFTRETTTTQEVSPTTASVKVTDFTSGESVKTSTTTSPTGKISTSRTASGSGGGSVSSQREQQLIQATKELETIQAEKKLQQAKANELSPTAERKFETQLKEIERRTETPITFGQEKKFAESFRRASGLTSFTLAVPIRRQNGMLRVQDYNFLFKDGELIRKTATGTALITEEQFRKADARRRKKYPEFTFGSTTEIISKPKITTFGLPSPKITISPKLRKFGETASDVFTGLTFGTFLEHLTRPTGMTVPEIKTEAKESSQRAFKQSIFFGMGLPFGLGVGVKGSGKVGVGVSSLIGSLQAQQILSAVKIRESGKETIAIQEKQVGEINKVVKGIEEEQSKLSDPTKFAKDVEQFSKDLKKFESGVSSASQRISLVTTQKSLQKEQERLTKEQKTFEDITTSKLEGLKLIGVESVITKTGKIEFTSKELEKIVAPVGIKLQKSFLKDDKLSTKNILLGTTAITREVGIAYGIGLGTGGIGFIARIGSRIAKLPKVARIGAYGGAVGLAGLGITTTTIRGFKVGEVEGIGKIGAVIGGLTATGQLTGFGAGAFKGTKGYLAKIEKQIISGRTTKGLADIKVGTIFEGKGGLAKQLSKFETKITGTKFKITSLAEIKSKFIKDIGTSDIKIISKLEGKVPKGIPLKITTKGLSLETKDLIKARLFTKVPSTKGFLKQDVLISRKVLDIKALNLKTFYKPFVKLERIKVLSGMKILGEPIKVKAIPKDIFTLGEKYLFKVSKGAQKVAGIGEYAMAKPDTLFASKQFILTTKALKVGDIKVKAFRTLTTTKGASVDLLKDSLRGKLLVLDLKTKQLSSIGLDKKGQVTAFRPPRLEIPKLKPLKIKTDFKTTIDSKVLLKIHLKQIVPKIIARESALIKPTVLPTTASLIGLKSVLDTRQISKLKLDLGLKMSQISTQKLIQQPKLKTSQLLKMKLVTVPVTQRALTIAPPKIVLPVIPKLPPLVLGTTRRKKKKKKGARTYDALTFSEGFTAKTLDLSPRVLSPIQARQLLSMKLTGIGIRRGVIIK